MVDAGRVLFQVGIDRSSADRAIADLERRLAAVGDIDLKLPNTSAANGVARQVESAFARIKVPEFNLSADTRKLENSVNRAKGVFQEIEIAIAALNRQRIEVDFRIKRGDSDLARLEAQLQGLQDKRIQINANAQAATAEVQAIDERLKALTRNAVQLELDVESEKAQSELIAVNARIERLEARRIRVQATVDNVDPEVAKVEAKINELNARKIKIEADTGSARTQISQLDKTLDDLRGDNAQQALERLQREFRETGDAAQKAGGETKSFNSILAGLSAGAASQLIGKLVEAFGALTNAVTGFVAASVQANATIRVTENALTAVLGSQEAAAESIDFLKQTAIDTGQNFEALIGSYSGLSAAAANFGVPQEEVNELFLETSRNLGIFGKSGAEGERVFNALEQIFSKGKVSLEELTGQLGEQLPTALGAAAAGLKETGVLTNGTTAELLDLIDAGLDAATFGQGLTAGLKLVQGEIDPTQKALASLEISIGDLQRALGKSLEPLEVAFSDTFGTIFREVDVSALDPLAEAGERLRDALADNPELAERLGEALSSVLAAGAEVTAELLDEITRILSKPENIERFASELESIADTILVVGSAAANSIDKILAIADAFTKVAERLVPSLRLLGVAEDIIQRLSNSKPIEIKGSVNFDESVSEGAAGLGVDLDNSRRTRLSREELSQKVQDNKEASDQVAADADRAAKAAAAAKVKADKEAAEQFKQANLDAISAIDVAQSNRIAGVRQNQAAGNITEDEADAQISSIEIEGIQERIALREDEIAKIEDFASRKVISEKDAADQIRKANEGIADLTLEAVEKEIEAQDAAAAAAKDKAEEAVKAAESQLDAQQRLNDLQSEQINIQSELALTALQDQASLIGAQADLEQSRLSLSRQTLEAKLAEATAIEDSVAVEELRDRILINQRQSIAAEFSARRQSLQIQQQQVSLDADRESRLGRIAEAEAKIALERARLDNGTTDEELSGLEEIVKLREEQTDSLKEQARTQQDILTLQLEQLDTDEQIAEQQATAERRQQAIEKSLKNQKDLADEQLKTEKDLASATKDRANAAESIVSALSGLEDVSQADALGNLDQLEGNLGTARRAGVLDDDDANQLQSAINQAQRFSRGGFDVDEAFRFASQNEDNPFAGGVLDAVGLGGVNSFFDAQQELQLADSQISTLTEEIRSVKAAIEQSFPDTIENNFNVGDTTDPYEQIAAITGAVARGARG